MVSNVVPAKEHQSETPSSWIKHNFIITDVRRAISCDELGLRLKTKTTSKYKKYWIIDGDTNKVVFGGKIGRCGCSVDHFLEEKRDRIAQTLGFMSASSMRMFARHVNSLATTDDCSYRKGWYGALRFYREML